MLVKVTELGRAMGRVALERVLGMKVERAPEWSMAAKSGWNCDEEGDGKSDGHAGGRGDGKGEWGDSERDASRNNGRRDYRDKDSRGKRSSYEIRLVVI